MKSADYIELLREKNGWNYTECAEALGLSKQSMTSYRNNNVEMEDETCIAVAELLELDPLLVIANVRAARHKSGKAKDFWEKIASTAAGIILCVSASAATLYPTDSIANEESGNADKLCIMLN